jgi:hypothetical protein
MLTVISGIAFSLLLTWPSATFDRAYQTRRGWRAQGRLNG